MARSSRKSSKWRRAPRTAARPITLSSLAVGWPGQAVALEAAATSPPGRSRLKRRFAVTRKFFINHAFFKFKLKKGDLDGGAYVADIAANADFRKFDDGLRMTLDCSPELADALEQRLQAANDIADYGTFRQSNALMTCFVPSITDRGHVHFVDGAGGGYAMAALAMKARRAPA